MKKIFSRIIGLLFIVSLITSAVIQNAPKVYATTSATHANSSTTLGSGGLHSIWHGDSYTVGYGNFSKITLYLARTNDPNEFPRNADGSLKLDDISVTDSSGKPIFVKFGKSIIDRENYTLPTTSYVNIDTCKYDTLIDFDNGTKRAPAYKTKLSNSQLTSVGIPEWLKPDDSSNQPAVVNWITDKDNKTRERTDKYANLNKLIMKIAAQSDPSSATGLSAVNNLLATTKSKTTFDYTDSDGKTVDLTPPNVMPWGQTSSNADNTNGIGYWIVVYEPVIYYAQDPNKMFYPRSGGNSFLMSASDAVLTNMYSGTKGYPSIVKFGHGTPAVTASYNHCDICELTWFGYPSWKNSSLPLAQYCPLPCPGITKDYDGVKTVSRHPFAISSAIKQAARTFSVAENFLQYKKGFLMDKPTSSMTTLITAASDESDILHYGGYSAFVSYPKPMTSPVPTESYYVRAVGVNSDHSFTVIPGITVDLTTKDDIKTAALRTQTEAAATKWIKSQKASFQPKLTAAFTSIKGGTYPKEIKTGTDFVSIPYEVTDGSSKLGIANLLKNYKVYPNAIKEVTPPEIPNYDITGYINELLDSGDYANITQKIQAYIGTLKNAADASKVVAQDGTITLDDGTKIGKNETVMADWSKLVVFASEDKNINSLDKINLNNVFFYDTKNNTWQIPDGFTFKGKPLYITVIVAVVRDEEPNLTPGENVLYENELVKAIKDDTISRVSVEKTSVDTTCPGYTSVWHDGWTDVKKVYHEGYYSYPSCGHDHTLANAKNVIPKTLNVQTAWYWNEAMFNGLSRLAILRPSGALTSDGVTFVFNTTSPFTSTDMSNAFGELTSYRFLTSRNATSSPLQLAAYMNNSTLNKSFLSFINPYFSNYPSAYSNPNGFFGGSNLNIVTASVLPSSITAIGSGVFCSGGSSNSLSISSKFTSSDFMTSTNITVESTISSSAKSSPSLQTQGVYYNIGAPDMGFITRYKSQPISFFPAFQMKYDKDNSGQNSSNVWILANGERKFLSYDNVAMEVLESKISLDGPFSRDREDRWVDPDATHLVARNIPTLKSGSAFKIDASGTLLRITVNAHIQDPAFVPESEREALIERNNQVIEGYDTYVKSVIAKIKSDGVSYYSNLLQANTKDTLNFLPSGNNVVDLSAKTTLRLAAAPTVNTSIFTSASYIDNNETADYAKNRTITVKGQSIPLRRWEDNSIIKSNAVLKDLLVENGGKTGFYNESYEGIVDITRVYLLELQNCSTSYCQVHTELSDWQTPRNSCAHELPFVYNKNLDLIAEGQFGIGLEVRFPPITFGGVTQTPVLCSSAYLLDIRGSIYDTK